MRGKCNSCCPIVIRGEAAKRLLQELNHPTPEQLEERRLVLQKAKELAKSIKIKSNHEN